MNVLNRKTSKERKTQRKYNFYKTVHQSLHLLLQMATVWLFQVTFLPRFLCFRHLSLDHIWIWHGGSQDWSPRPLLPHPPPHNAVLYLSNVHVPIFRDNIFKKMKLTSSLAGNLQTQLYSKYYKLFAKAQVFVFFLPTILPTQPQNLIITMGYSHNYA